MPVGDQMSACLSFPFGVNAKKRKSATTDTFEDADRIVMHNLDTSDGLSEDSIEPSKRRRHADNSAGIRFSLPVLSTFLSALSSFSFVVFV